jgi:hypothetical protein
MTEDEALKLADRTWLLRDLKQQCEANVEARVDRYLRIGHHSIVANTPFAGASAECVGLFRDGHYYGCISLSQSVGEALVWHMCRSNKWKPAENFEENVATLRRRGFIDEGVKAAFLLLWTSRDDYHHLNGSVVTERAELEELGLTKVRALATIEARVFGFSQSENGLILSHPQYWPNNGIDQPNSFLRIDPAV